MITKPLPQTEARARIAALPRVSREVMDGMLPELKAYAFTITGLDVGDQMARVHDSISAVPGGEKTWDESKKEIAAELADALGGGQGERRAELLLRTHVFRSYAATRYRLLMEQVDVFPYWQYKTHGDGNVRPSHMALNGKIFPAGHEIWQRIFPPWDWGCRCLVVPLTAGAVRRMQDAGMEPQANEDDTLLKTQIVRPEVFDARMADVIEKGQRLPNGVSLNPSQTWSGAPWSIPGNIRHDWPLIEARYKDQPEVLEAFREWAGKTEIEPGVTVSMWVGGEDSRGRRGSIERSEAVRANEARAIRASRPKRKQPASEKMALIGKGGKAALEKAMWLVDHAHDDGEMGDVTLKFERLGGSVIGAYAPKLGKLPASIRVDPDAAHPVMAALHEIGHHLRLHFDPADVAKLADLARQTRSAEMIEFLGLDDPRDPYWLKESELFARVYAQFVAERTRGVEGGEAAAELDDIFGSPDSYEQFSRKEDWQPLRDHLESMLKRKKWL